MPSEKRERRRGAGWVLGTFYILHRFWSSALGLSVTDLESRSCSQQLVLNGSFICPLDYPENRHEGGLTDTAVPLAGTAKHIFGLG